IQIHNHHWISHSQKFTWNRILKHNHPLPIEFTHLAFAMALKTIIPNSSTSHFPHLSVVHLPPSCILCHRDTLIRQTYPAISLRKSCYFLFPIPLEILSTGRSKRYVKSTEESTEETSAGNDDDDDSGEESYQSSDEFDRITTGGSRRNVSSLSDALNLGSRDPVYEPVTLKTYSQGSCGSKFKRNGLNQKSSQTASTKVKWFLISGLRPRDIRSVDPSLWLTNTMPSLLVRENAILLNLGSLRAIAMQESVFIFNYNRRGGKAFIDDLLPRLNPKSMIGGGLVMPFELEVVEAALHSRIQHFEHRLMDLDPHRNLCIVLQVQDLLKVLPNRLTAGILEQLRICKQTLVELGSKAGALRQMLLDILEDSQEIRRLCIVGRNCILGRNSDVECSVPLEKQIAEEEEEEIEMLLENYLHRCESCHNQAERLLDSAREMEDSIAVNLSSRRLQVSRFELLLQVGTFCLAVGALVSGIFGMNLRSYLEEHVFAFWLTTAGIVFGAVVAFFLTYSYLRSKKIL
ncbi:Magnesium transporter MRS2/LPE10, partial [Cynara cardunculus var. scolymus]